MRLIRTVERGFKETLSKVAQRGKSDSGRVEQAVAGILDEVRQRGDDALAEFTAKFDGHECPPERIPVSKKEIDRAYRKVPRSVLELFGAAAERIRSFHARQRQESWFTTEKGGSVMGQLVTPLDRVGLYVPGGKAAYPSSVLMNAIPAQVAGVASLAICTPSPDGVVNPHVLAAADLLGIEEIYRVGGAQAVGAMAYGTATIPRVDKIVGPGNIYVATAKRIVYGEVDIDMVAGPSEILIVADSTAEPAHLAADLLSQAEHDEEALCILVTDSMKLAERVRVEVHRQVESLPASRRALAAIEGQGMIVVVRSLTEAFDVANTIAPEHLEVATADPFHWIPSIRHAGSIFLGHHTPEPMGDYLAGPNHVLPTGGTARFSSTLGVDSFVKKSNILFMSPEDFARWGPGVADFARLEGLEAHARSVLMRLEGAKGKAPRTKR